jgi:hypothetical protein
MAQFYFAPNRAKWLSIQMRLTPHVAMAARDRLRRMDFIASVSSIRGDAEFVEDFA